MPRASARLYSANARVRLHLPHDPAEGPGMDRARGAHRPALRGGGLQRVQRGPFRRAADRRSVGGATEATAVNQKLTIPNYRSAVDEVSDSS